MRRVLHDCASSDLDSLAHVDNLLDAARELVGEWVARGEILRRMEVVEFSRDLWRVSGSLLRQAEGAHQRSSFEDGLRRLGFTSLSLGIFEEPGRASERCRLLAAFEPNNRPMLQAYFPSSDLSVPGVFDHERDPLLGQALVCESEPIGVLTVPLGGFHTSLYEPMRETLAIGLGGFRLAARPV